VRVSRAQEILDRREAIGWKLGLERMRRLCSLLGLPQHRFASVHVVGTNGKTSVTRMTMALLEAHGVSAGAYVSPHIASWRERVLIHGEPLSEEGFAAAIERAEQAAKAADRVAAEDEGPVTQFELVTAAAFWALAEARVEVGVIEAGLGGRLDATNVIPSKVTVLTSVGLDHTEWLGETLEEIAAEKLAVLRDHTTLIRGELPQEVVPIVKREIDRHKARAVCVTTAASNLVVGYQAGNLALAEAAVRQVLGRVDPEGEIPLIRRIASSELSIPGRAEKIPGDPPMIFDAAHNPQGALALAAALPDLAGVRRVRGWWRRRERPRPVVCCLAILAEKDARAMIAALSPACSTFVCTQVPDEAIRGSGRPVGTSHSAEDLAALCRAVGAVTEAVADPLRAWDRVKELARKQDGVALACGSHYLLACIWTERHAASS
jgi:dihydrofolate synthase/folylpolyglutamate synthase